MDQIKNNEVTGAELMGKFLGAWVKYGFMMLYVGFASIAHVVNKVNGIKGK